MTTGAKSMKAGFDENFILWFSEELSADEVSELNVMLTEAFESGLRCGYWQGKDRGLAEGANPE